MRARIVGSFAIIMERGNAGMRAWKVRRAHCAGKGNSAKCVPELWEVSQRVQVCWAEFCGIGASDFHKKNKAMELCLMFV